LGWSAGTVEIFPAVGVRSPGREAGSVSRERPWSAEEHVQMLSKAQFLDLTGGMSNDKIDSTYHWGSIESGSIPRCIETIRVYDELFPIPSQEYLLG